MPGIQLRARIPPKVYEQFEEVCEQNNLQPNDVIKVLISIYIKAGGSLKDYSSFVCSSRENRPSITSVEPNGGRSKT